MNPYDAMYEGTPPWEIGRPQEAFVQLAAAGRITGRVLDVGCGTGDAVVHLASQGIDAWGVDASRTAIVKAKAKAAERHVKASFLVADALALWHLGTAFDTVLDCGLFHGFDDEAREAYLHSLSRVIRRGGTLHLLCFSDREPDWGGPRRVTRQELRAAFSGGWWVESITEARFANRLKNEGSAAWLATVTWGGQPLPGVH